MAFDQLVLEAYAPLHNAYFDQLAGVDLLSLIHISEPTRPY